METLKITDIFMACGRNKRIRNIGRVKSKRICDLICFAFFNSIDISGSQTPNYLFVLLTDFSFCKILRGWIKLLRLNSSRANIHIYCATERKEKKQMLTDVGTEGRWQKKLRHFYKMTLFDILFYSILFASSVDSLISRVPPVLWSVQS